MSAKWKLFCFGLSVFIFVILKPDILRWPYQYHGNWCPATVALTHLPLVPHACVSESGQHWFRYWLFAYSLPSHYLNQCCVIVNSTFSSTLQWNFNQNTKFSFTKKYLKVSSAKWRPFCPVGDELRMRDKPVLAILQPPVRLSVVKWQKMQIYIINSLDKFGATGVNTKQLFLYNVDLNTRTVHSIEQLTCLYYLITA